MSLSSKQKSNLEAVANRLRINSIKSTQASNSGYTNGSCYIYLQSTSHRISCTSCCSFKLYLWTYFQTSDVMRVDGRGHLGVVLPHDEVQSVAPTWPLQRPLRPLQGLCNLSRFVAQYNTLCLSTFCCLLIGSRGAHLVRSLGGSWFVSRIGAASVEEVEPWSGGSPNPGELKHTFS